VEDASDEAVVDFSSIDRRLGIPEWRVDRGVMEVGVEAGVEAKELELWCKGCSLLVILEDFLFIVDEEDEKLPFSSIDPGSDSALDRALASFC